MCTFVFLALPRAHRGLTESLRSAGIAVSPNTNHSLAAVFPANTECFEVTRGGCSCALYSHRPTEDGAERARARYRRKGWSTAKIERAVASQGKVERSEHKAFREAVVAAVMQSRVLHLCAHTFTGLVTSEVVVVENALELEVAAFVEAAGSYPMDTLVTLVSSPR